MFFNIFFFYNYFSLKLIKLINNKIDTFLIKINFINFYYHLNELLWQDGLLIDFLQKKIVDNWIRRFLINSAYLFNERFLFDKIVRFYLDLIIWPMHSLSIFEFNNVFNTLFIILFFFILILFLLLYLYIFIIFF